MKIILVSESFLLCVKDVIIHAGVLGVMLLGHGFC